MKVSKDMIRQNNYKEILAICSDIIPENEVVCVVLKGTFKEYLICTNKMVYILKKGFMTGHMFGKGELRLPYSKINNAEVVFHLASGYFEISTAGMQNKHYNYWSQNKKDNPSQQPNVIAITDKGTADLFRQAAQFILEHSDPNHISSSGSTTSNADELKKYADLYKQGLLTRAEFEKKKKELL